MRLVPWLLAGAVSLGVTPAVQAAFDGSVSSSYTHVNTTPLGETIEYTEAAPSPPNAHYSVDGSIAGQFFSLAARTKVQVSVDSPEGVTESWQSTQATAQATSVLSDTANVLGVPGVPGGTILFTWDVIGDTDVQIDTTGNNRVSVADLFSSVMLTSNMLGDESVLLNARQDYPGSADAQSADSVNETFHQSQAIASPPLTFQVPWTAGTPVTVDFQLAVQSTMNLVPGGEVARYSAGSSGEFFNTAHLLAADIFDAAGNRLELGRLQSGIDPTQNYPVSAVPEPSAAALFVAASASLIMMVRRTVA